MIYVCKTLYYFRIADINFFGVIGSEYIAGISDKLEATDQRISYFKFKHSSQGHCYCAYAYSFGSSFLKGPFCSNEQLVSNEMELSWLSVNTTVLPLAEAFEKIADCLISQNCT